MHSGLVTALSAPDIKNKLADLGVEPGGDTPDATQAFVLREIDRWAKVIQQTGTKIN